MDIEVLGVVERGLEITRLRTADSQSFRLDQLIRIASHSQLRFLICADPIRRIHCSHSSIIPLVMSNPSRLSSRLSQRKVEITQSAMEVPQSLLPAFFPRKSPQRGSLIPHISVIQSHHGDRTRSRSSFRIVWQYLVGFNEIAIAVHARVTPGNNKGTRVRPARISWNSLRRDFTAAHTCCNNNGQLDPRSKAL